MSPPNAMLLVFYPLSGAEVADSYARRNGVPAHASAVARNYQAQENDVQRWREQRGEQPLLRHLDVAVQ